LTLFEGTAQRPYIEEVADKWPNFENSGRIFGKVAAFFCGSGRISWDEPDNTPSPQQGARRRQEGS